MRWIALILLAAGVARADENDLQLFRLGHPDAINCTRCDGSSGDAPEPGTPDAQARFHRLASTLGMAFAPPFQEPAGTLGQSGFELGLSSNQAFLKLDGSTWTTNGTASGKDAPKVLIIPTLTARKGLGGSVELGVAVSWLSASQMGAVSAEVRIAPLDGVAYAPDLGLRAWGTRPFGTQELDLFTAGADVLLSKSFGLGGMVKLQPYFQGGVQWINAVSAVVDFKPTAESSVNPTADDGIFQDISFLKNRYLRGALGVRLVAGAVVLAVEGNLVQGTNAVSDVAPSTDPKNFVRLYSLSGRLGFTY